MEEEEINICILCKETCVEREKFIQKEDWDKLRDKELEWKGLDKYGDVCETVDWETDPAGKLWHKACKREICGERKLEQAKTRKRKSDERVSKIVEEKKSNNDPVPTSSLSVDVQVLALLTEKICVFGV